MFIYFCLVLNVDLDAFNHLCENERQARDMNAFAFMQLCGGDLDEPEGNIELSVNLRTDIHDDENMVTDVDIDMFGVMSAHIPCARTFSLRVIPSFSNTFTSRNCTLYQGDPINLIPSMFIGNYGDSSRIKVISTSLIFHDIYIDT